MYYWRSVLEYCVQGNLQAVMDKYIHILRESMGLAYGEVDDAVSKMGEEISKALALRTVTVTFDEIQIDDNHNTINIRPQERRRDQSVQA